MLDLSVVLTTRNRASLLGQTLEGFTKLNVEGLRWELLVVDNGSTDTTPQVLASYARRLPLRPLTEPEPGKTRALNLALPLVRGAVVVFTDDDVVPRPTWLSVMMAAVRRWPDDHIFGGRVVPLFPAATPEWMRTHRLTDVAFARFTPDRPEGPLGLAPFGPNYAVRSHLLTTQRFAVQLGPSSGRCVLGDETELLTRLIRAGNRVIFVPASEVGHVVRDEQIRAPWLFQRALIHGRTSVRFAHLFSNPLPSVPQLCWDLLTTGMRYFALRPFAPADTRGNIERGTTFHYRRGQLDERRRLARAAN
jgi:glycosyltransferase involved in cell wall biosynthesis